MLTCVHAETHPKRVRCDVGKVAGSHACHVVPICVHELTQNVCAVTRAQYFLSAIFVVMSCAHELT